MKKPVIDFLEAVILGHGEMSSSEVMGRTTKWLLAWAFVTVVSLIILSSNGFADLATLMAIIFPFGLFIINLGTKRKLGASKKREENEGSH